MDCAKSICATSLRFALANAIRPQYLVVSPYSQPVKASLNLYVFALDVLDELHALCIKKVLVNIFVSIFARVFTGMVDT